MKNKNNMKMLMENFNKFLEEQEMPEVEMEEEEESPDLEMAMDELLDDILKEGILKEYGIGDEYDHLRSSPDEEPASKEEVKSAIKKVVKSPEGQKVAQEIEKAAEQQAGGVEPSADDYMYAARLAVEEKEAIPKLMMGAASIPGLAALGALFGGAGAEPHHSSSAWLNNPEAIERAVDLGTQYGAYGGAGMGLIILAMIIAHMVSVGNEDAQRQADYRARISKYKKPDEE